jgi:putative DNA primase/helicase
LGYCLVPSSAFQKYLVTVGSGANGKSVLNAVIRALLGSENCCSVSPADFSNRFYLELLRDKLANVVDEFAAGAIVSDEGLKKSCDGSPITSSQKYKNPTPFISYATGIYGTNHLPKATDTSHGFFRRAVVLPFNRRFNPPDPNVPDDPDRQDPNLIDALLSELPGILNFGIEGLCRLHQNNGFTHCPSSATAVSEWRSDLDPIPDFVGECCSLGPAKEVLSSVLYERYKHWSGNERSSEKLLSQRTFSQRIKNDWGVSNDQRDSAGKTKLTGIGLRDLFNH